MEKNVLCPLCGHEVKRYPTINDRFGVSCELCGDYIMTGHAAVILRSFTHSDRSLLSLCVGNIHRDFGKTPVLDDLEIFKLMAAGVPEA